MQLCGKVSPAAAGIPFAVQNMQVSRLGVLIPFCPMVAVAF